MLYPNFNKIDIRACGGVSPVGPDTMLLAKEAARLKPKSSLEIGVGTGFISVYLKSLGIRAEGTDIDLSAIACARGNAKANGLKLPLYESDLFNKVKGRYYLIIFNPPVMQSRSGFVNSIRAALKQFAFLSEILFYILPAQRKPLLGKFLQGAKTHLMHHGSILLFVHKVELPFLVDSTLNLVILSRVGGFVLVMLKRE